MKPLHKYIAAALLALTIIGGAGYWVFSPSVWERDAMSSIKAGDYDEAIKVAKRGLIEKTGNRNLQALFLVATALNRSKDGENDWRHSTVSNGASRLIADLNIVGHLSEAKDVWVDGETRQKVVDLAQEELREIKKGFASKGMPLEDIKDLKAIGRAAAKAFLGLKLDTDKHEVQRANLAAYKTLLLLGDSDGVKGVLTACETAKNLGLFERVEALVVVASKDLDVIKKISVDKDHSLYKEARIAMNLAGWSQGDGAEILKKYEQIKLTHPTGENWDEFACLVDVDSAKRLRVVGFPAFRWNTDKNELIGAVYAWNVPMVVKDKLNGIGVVGRLEESGLKIVPMDRFQVIEDDIRPKIVSENPKSGDPVRLAVRVASRQEIGTSYRDESRYNQWRGFHTERVAYQSSTRVPYWLILSYNPSTKRMESQGYRKGTESQALFAPETEKVDTVPVASN